MTGGASSIGRRAPLSPARKRLFVALLIVVFLVGQEVLLRLIFPVPEVLNFNRIHYSQLLMPDVRKPKFLSNVAYRMQSAPDGWEFFHFLNLYGFRDRQWTVEKPAGTTRVLFMGDSFTEGAGADGEHTIPEGFKRAAGERAARFDVMNMGIQATGMSDFMVLSGQAMPVFKPDVVMLVLFGNDFAKFVPYNPAWLSGQFAPPPVFADQRKPRLWQVIEILRAGQRPPKSWYSRPFPFFASIPDPRNPFADEQKARYYATFIPEKLAGAMAYGRFNPYLIDTFHDDKSYLAKDMDVRPYLAGLKQFLTDRGARLMIAYIPTNNQVSDAYLQYQSAFCRPGLHSLMGPEYQRHAAHTAVVCEELAIPFLDFTPLLRELEAQGNRLYWNFDNHMRGESYAMLGDNLYRWYASMEPAQTKNATK